MHTTCSPTESAHPSHISFRVFLQTRTKESQKTLKRPCLHGAIMRPKGPKLPVVPDTVHILEPAKRRRAVHSHQKFNHPPQLPDRNAPCNTTSVPSAKGISSGVGIGGQIITRDGERRPAGGFNFLSAPLRVLRPVSAAGPHLRCPHQAPVSRRTAASSRLPKNRYCRNVFHGRPTISNKNEPKKNRFTGSQLLK
ncbi:hypothetical protein J2Z19_000429 [Ensifer adhaerens]|uniref:Uncharacterized protein n=1 Tax=Ensifer adhaerens TaxID=106592 RepID=A0ACC5SPG9_ENSAD|nr:hypothetical protein [Ensifer adhaerens]